LAGTVASHGYPVAEEPRMDCQETPRRGENRRLTSHQFAAATPVEKRNMARRIYRTLNASSETMNAA
jgi:hypothetical protein